VQKSPRGSHDGELAALKRATTTLLMQWSLTLKNHRMYPPIDRSLTAKLHQRGLSRSFITCIRCLQ